MTAGVESYLEQFRASNGARPQWLVARRRDAMDRFEALGFPTPRLEDWKYTNVDRIARTPFRAAPAAAMRADDLRSVCFGDGAAAELVFVNGRYRAELSAVRQLSPGASVGSLREVIGEGGAGGGLLEEHIGQASPHDERAFVALNTALFDDGVVIVLDPGVRIEGPIHLVFWTSAVEPSAVHPRVLILAGSDSHARVVESYVGFGAYFVNAVTEVVLERGAEIEHYKFQRESGAAFHVGTIDCVQRAGSRFRSMSLSIGAELARTDVRTRLDAEEAECSLDGLYLAIGRQHVDHHTAIDHRKPRCRSRELYKGVLDGRAKAVFNGKVLIREDAQQSDAHQINRNLLLSETSEVDTKPELEIFADDVKCSHGATIGRLDEDALFYLRSRGIGAAEARNLLIFGFANELVGRVSVEPLRLRIEQVLQSRFHEPHPEGHA